MHMHHNSGRKRQVLVEDIAADRERHGLELRKRMSPSPRRSKNSKGICCAGRSIRRVSPWRVAMRLHNDFERACRKTFLRVP